MAGKLLQCLMLLCLALACYGYLRLFMRSFRLPPEFALVSFLSALALTLFAAGCLGLLLPASWLLLALGAALGLLSLLRRESLRPLCTLGMLLWLLLSGLSLYLVFGQKFYYVDDFSHWATAVKTLLENDAFPTTADKLIYFPDYPLGSSVLIYWFARMSGINSEWFQMLVQAVYISACLALPAVFIPGGGRKTGAFGLLLWAAAAFGILGANIELTSLYVDTLLPLAGLAGVWLHLYGRDRERSSILPLLILCCYTVTVKESGIFFAAVIIVLALLDSRDKKTGLKHGALLALGTAAFKLLWSVHYRLTFGGGTSDGFELSLAGLFPGYADKLPGDVQTIAAGMLETLCRPETLLPTLTLLVIALLIGMGGENRRRHVKLCLMGLAFYLVYCLGQGAMYILFMPRGEAVRLAAFDRYFASIQIFLAGYLLVPELMALKDGGGSPGFRRGLALLCAMLSLLVLSPQGKYFVRTEKRVPCFLAETDELLDLDWARETGKPEFWASIRSEYDRVIEQCKIPQGLTYTVFIGEDYGIEVRVLTNYLLSSAGTYVVTDEMLRSGQDLDVSYEYYIILEETQANTAFVREHYGKTDRAAYTY